MLPLILLTQIALSIANPTPQCDLDKIAITDGEYTLTDGGNVGSIVEYTCPEGKYPYPAYSRECLPQGEWTDEQKKAQCRAVQCPRPIMFESGEVYPRKGRYFVGDVLHFDCWGGFRMIGPQNRTCQANGKWSGEETKCDDEEGDCPNPGIPLGASKVGSSYKIENKVTYECQPGLFMYGSKERVCMENKRWSGAEPTCRYSYTFDTPKEVAETFSASLSETIESSDPDKDGEGNTDRTIKVETGGDMNIFIIIDASKSVGPKNFNTAKKISEVFIDKMASFDFIPRYGVISYASFAKSIMLLSDDDSNNAEEVIERIRKFQYKEHGDTERQNTGAPLKKVYNMMFLEKMKDAEKFLNTRNVIILMTDGKYNVGGDPTVEVKRIREFLNIRTDNNREDFLDIYVFGLGDDVSDKEINYIASKKDRKKHVFKMQSVDDMKAAFDEILDESEILQMCGLSKETSEEVEEKYPWIAKITITRPGFQEKCKGSIVSRDFILTAAHCFHLDDELHAISVRVGDKSFRVKELHRHPLYNPLGKRDKNVERSFDYDMALIQLDSKIKFSKTIRPICLPCTSGTSWALKQRGKSVTCKDHANTLLPSELEKALFIAEEKEKDLKEMNVLIKQGSKRLACLEDTKKIDKFKDIPDIKELITDNFLCTGGTEPQVDPQTCKGDGGGPLIVQYKQRFIQVGIISWGTINSCTGPRRNPGPVPALSRDFHANVFNMLDWLKEKMPELEFMN